MSEYDRNRQATGHSRAKGRKTTSKTGSRTTGRSSYSTSSRTGSRSTGRSSSVKRSGRTPSGNYGQYYSGGGSGGGWWKAVVGLVLVVAVVSVAFAVKGKKLQDQPEETTVVETTVPETELEKNVSVDGIDITGMSRDLAKAAILKQYPWSMKITYGEDSVDVANMMEAKVDSLLNDIYTGEPAETYTLDTTGLEDQVTAQAAAAAAKWDKAAKNGSISSYNADSNSFQFTGAETGIAIDQAKLVADMTSALSMKKFDAVIEAQGAEVQPEFSEATAKDKYKTISSFTTNTTANSKRNTNIKLAAQAINGTVLQPGEEFSFNGVVGERTEAKGYKGAAAYNNGEVVEEIGGGVCQVSTTVYNAVVRAGLKTTVRRSHTFEPSYVTPGEDATVSWGGPDYKFVNSSSAAIGIRASYSDQTVTVSIYGIPVLEDGEKRTLKSTKVKDADPPAPTYEEDTTLQPGVEVKKSSGSVGSYWETRLVITKDGKEVSSEIDHTTNYKGHPPVIRRNTSGVVTGTTAAEETSPAVLPEGAADALPPSEGTVITPSAAVETTVGKTETETTKAPVNIEEGPGAAASTTAAATQAATAAPAPTAAETQAAPAAPAAPVQENTAGEGLIAPSPIP